MNINKRSMKFYLFIILLILFNSCATIQKKVDKSYLKGSYELNTGDEIDTQIQIERELYRLEKAPMNWKVKNNLLVLYRKKRNFQQAIKYGREILHHDTKNYIALNNLAMVYYDMKKL